MTQFFSTSSSSLELLYYINVYVQPSIIWGPNSLLIISLIQVRNIVFWYKGDNAQSSIMVVWELKNKSYVSNSLWILLPLISSYLNSTKLNLLCITSKRKKPIGSRNEGINGHLKGIKILNSFTFRPRFAVILTLLTALQLIIPLLQILSSLNQQPPGTLKPLSKPV